jgi:hypothetical protein
MAEVVIAAQKQVGRCDEIAWRQERQEGHLPGQQTEGAREHKHKWTKEGIRGIQTYFQTLLW